jgi:thiol-disulfide isomerase/thioredoxin
MLRMPPVIYENKIINYVDKVIPQIPDSINPELDRLIAKSRTNDELFRYMLVTLFNHYAKSQIMGFDAVQVYLAEKYYIPEAKWSDTAYMSKLKDFVKHTKPLLLGKVAPDIQLVRVPTEHFIAAADSMPMKKDPYVGSFFDLHDLQSKFIVLYFWDAECGHCKKATPVMYEAAQKIKSKDVEVIAVSLQFGVEGKVKWINYINENKFYDWTNAWNPYDYKFKELYDVSSTPQIFILDKDKKIIAKRIGPEQVEEIINVYSKRDAKK